MNEKCLKKWPIDEKVLMLVAESPKQENGNFFPGCVCNDFFSYICHKFYFHRVTDDRCEKTNHNIATTTRCTPGTHLSWFQNLRHSAKKLGDG